MTVEEISNRTQASLEKLEVLSNTFSNQHVVRNSQASARSSQETDEVDRLRDDHASSEAPLRSSQDTLRLSPEPSHSRSGATMEQFETLKSMIRQLQQQITRQGEKLAADPIREMQTGHSKAVQTDQAVSNDISNEEADALAESDGLLKRIARFCRFTEKKGATLFSEDAQLIIDDLDKILGDKVFDHSVSEARKRKRGENPGACEGLLEEQMDERLNVKRIRGFLASSQCVAINQPGLNLSVRV